MNILIVSNEATGVDYYRLSVPHKSMDGTKHYVVPHLSGLPNLDRNLGKFDIAIFNRTISNTGDTKNICAALRRNGVKIVVDIDDYWVLPSNHLNYKATKFKEKLKYDDPRMSSVYFFPTAKEVTDSFREADLVTCATPHLAQKVKKYNNNVEVVPNGITTEDQQWSTDKKELDGAHIGWIGGVHHIKDLSIHFNSFKSLREYDKDHKIYYGGWVDAPENNLISKYISGGGNNTRFNNIKAMDIWNYAQMYDHINISLAPLQNNEFNRCKSELKAIEAGFKKCAIVAQDMYPYKYICDETNSILFKKDLFSAVKKLIDNPNLREDISEKLHEDVVDKYSLSKINIKRRQVYDNLCN